MDVLWIPISPRSLPDFARHNVLVQASAAMTAQANQLTNVALQLLG